MADMMVNLRVLRDLEPVLDEQKANGVEIRRARVDESGVIAEWVRENINPNWGSACEVALESTPLGCFVAFRKKSPSDANEKVTAETLLGFACYDVVRKGVFGPSGVREDHENGSISTALMIACLHAMAAEDYPHAVIGWASATESYAI